LKNLDVVHYQKISMTLVNKKKKRVVKDQNCLKIMTGVSKLVKGRMIAC